MAAERPIVVIGFLGLQKDSRGKTARRWQHWRPTVSLVSLELNVSRIELLYDPGHETLAEQVETDIASKDERVDVCLHPFELDNPWDFEEVYDKLYRFASQYPFRPEEEAYRLHITTGSHVIQICLFLLCQNGVIPGQLLQTMDAESNQGRTHILIDLHLERYARLARLKAQARVASMSVLKQGIQTRNAKFNQMIERIEHVAVHSTEPMLIMGPTGAGKTALAERIYALKKARGSLIGQLVPVNCATLHGTNAMSALFGHVRGAFTGANQARAGLLKAAHKGLLFFDEIGELGLDEQAMLLRAIETGKFRPMGSDRAEHSTFQLIAGTNRDLRQAVATGKFREDLLARINLWTFTLPGLRERVEDIEPNLEYELDLMSRRLNAQVRFSTEARRLFLEFAVRPDSLWSANFRDLNNAVLRMATLCSDRVIGTKEVHEEIARLTRSWSAAPESATARITEDLTSRLLGEEQYQSLDLFDRVQLEEVLRVCRAFHSMSAAGRHLFAASRLHKKSVNDADRLRKYLKKFGLSWRDVQR